MSKTNTRFFQRIALNSSFIIKKDKKQSSYSFRVS